MEKLMKENLTYDNIVADYEAVLKNMRSKFIISIVILVSVLTLATGIFYMLPDGAPARFSFTAIIYVLVIGMMLYCLYKLARDRRMLKEGDFRIVEDKLVQLKGAVYSPLGKRRQPFRLVFHSYGTHSLYQKNYYASSKMFKTDDDGVASFAEIGDKYYVVLMERRIVLAYNAKMFNPIDLNIEKMYDAEAISSEV